MNVHNAGVIVLALLAVGIPLARAQDSASDIVELEVTGEGLTPDAARNAALRRALEQGAQVEISAYSHVRDFELIRDSIFSRADGLVTDYQILEQGPMAGGTHLCRIRARVKKSAIASTWGEVQNVLEQLGRPGIAVYILERIDGQVQDSSILESQIEKRLLEKGFLVYAGEQLRQKMEKEGADAQAEGNIPKVQAVAKDFGTQIFITGTAQANSAGVRELAGEPTAMYNGDAMIKMYYTDTGQLIASESLPNWRGGARGLHNISPQAGKKALENAALDLVEWAYNTAMRSWATRLSAGGELILEIEGVSMGDALKIKKMIRDLDPDKIVAVNGPALTKGIATLRIQAKCTGEELAEHLAAEPFEALFEIVDLKPNRIQAKAVGR